MSVGDLSQGESYVDHMSILLCEAEEEPVTRLGLTWVFEERGRYTVGVLSVKLLI